MLIRIQIQIQIQILSEKLGKCWEIWITINVNVNVNMRSSDSSFLNLGYVIRILDLLFS